MKFVNGVLFRKSAQKMQVSLISNKKKVPYMNTKVHLCNVSLNSY